MDCKKNKTSGDGVPKSKVAALPNDDWRLIENGSLIHAAQGYSDQPYFIRTDDGALLLVCTTGRLEEGEIGQHIISCRSTDNGQTWEKPVAIEPSDGPEASWAVLHKTPSSRVYAFYTYNADNVREIPADADIYPEGICRRVDTIGYFAYKYSDDNGKSWSKNRWIAPMRKFKLDRENPTGGKIFYFWNVGKPFTHNDNVYLPIIKVGTFGKGMFAHSEGALLCSNNLQYESDPEKLNFETLPEGDIGICAPEGEEPVSEEHSFAVLSDGTIFCVFRTVSGYSACCYSSDAGRNWTKPDFMRYPDGRKIKNPRAANFIWTLSGNRYLYWFHNNNGKTYNDRNPAWLLAAFETDTPQGKRLEFSQPEILLYTHGDINRRMSYPDLLELDDGSLLVSETEKLFARLHKIPRQFVEKICEQKQTLPLPSKDSLIFEWYKSDDACYEMPLPLMPHFFDRWAKKAEEINGGLTITVKINDCQNSQTLLDNRDNSGKGITLSITDDRKVKIELCDGRVASFWQSTSNLSGKDDSISVVIDGGSGVISIIINCKFDDGGDLRQFGWGRLHNQLQDVNAAKLRIADQVDVCRIYNRHLLTAEAIADQNNLNQKQQ
ncbi:MAG: sialidase family protein [Sedimentisphaeraceae bacterium JB056]